MEVDVVEYNVAVAELCIFIDDDCVVVVDVCDVKTCVFDIKLCVEVDYFVLIVCLCFQRATVVWMDVLTVSERQKLTWGVF